MSCPKSLVRRSQYAFRVEARKTGLDIPQASPILNSFMNTSDKSSIHFSRL